MLVAAELKGELARIHPARDCCRRAELAGLLYGDAAAPPGSSLPAALAELRTLDPATARVAVHLAAAVGALPEGSTGAARRASAARHGAGGRRRLHVPVDTSSVTAWSWADAPACDRRSFLRGLLLAAGSVSLSAHGPHVEFVFRDRSRAEDVRRRLLDSEVRAGVLPRRGRRVVYIKGREQVAALLRLTGANRALLDFESDRVGREVRNGLNRMLNAEEANLGRTVAAAGRQLRSIERLDRAGILATLSEPLRAAAALRQRQPDADLDSLASALRISRSATNHRLRRLVELADGLGEDGGQQPRPADRAAAARRG